MKAPLNKISTLLFVSFIIISCGNNTENQPNDESNKTSRENLDKIMSEIEDFIEDYDISRNPTETYDFCSSKKLLVEGTDRKYDTNFGVAYFLIPIPEGSTLRRVDKTNDDNEIYYECNGKIFSNNIIYKPIFISNLRKVEGDSVKIEVNYNNFEKIDCGDLQIEQEKKKGSVIGGEPFIPNGKKD